MAMLGFLLVSAVLAIFCSVYASNRNRLITLSVCLCIRCTSFRYSSYLLTVSCAYVAMLSLWFWSRTQPARLRWRCLS